jgi:hypothetical protein
LKEIIKIGREGFMRDTKKNKSQQSADGCPRSRFPRRTYKPALKFDGPHFPWRDSVPIDR